VCAIYRDEAPYLREWIEFHRLVGVERFFLYNNRSTDDHREVLEPYLEEGIVVLHEWPLFPGQRQAYNDCLVRHRDDSRWIAIIDLDEFLFSPSGHPVSQLLRSYEAAPGVCVNLAQFGTSGHRVRPPGLVIENYVLRTDDPLLNGAMKSIVDPSRVDRSHGAHSASYKSESAVNENHEPVDGTNKGIVSFSRLRINHYHTKSEEEWHRKLAEPSPAFGDMRLDRPPTPPPVGSPGRWWPAYYLESGGAVLNEKRDETILMYLPALREALARPVSRPIARQAGTAPFTEAKPAEER
jgi:glycosyl transferase family 92